MTFWALVPIQPLSTLAAVRTVPLVTTPGVPAGRGHVWHQYTVLLDRDVNRDRVAELMSSEGVDAGMRTEDALRHGISRTAGVVSAAALVMVGVFSLFGTASSLDLKEAGVGLAVAVLIDATVVRGVLLPATMKLLGERNWYLPSWLAWLPRASLEGETLEGGVADVPGPRPDPQAALASVAD